MIKFRAWRKDLKEMIDCDEGIGSTNDSPNTFFNENDIIVFMEYTGLKDMNGKDIYEGDVLQTKGNIDPFFYDIIIKKNGCFGYMASDKQFVAIGLNHHYFDLKKDSHQSHILEIIGNIYDNPELKKGD